MSPEPASYDPEEFVDGSQSWPRLLALKDGELLAKGEVFEHQTAARPKPAKQGSEPEPKQVKHGNQVIADRLYRLPAKLLISKPDRIVTRHSRAFFRQNLIHEPVSPAQNLKQVWFAGVHSDVGGSYAEAESGLSKIALRWMLC